jgi:hypothetical protein
MTLSDLAALGSFISGLAVLITLVLLLVQLRQTNRNQRALMQQGRAGQQVDLLLRCADENLSVARLKATAGDLTMTDQEIDVAVYVWLAIWRSLEDGFLQYKSGTLGLQSFQSDTAILRFLLTYPSLRATWRLIRERYAPQFRAYVDGLMSETSVAQPPREADLWRALVREEQAAANA